MQCPKCHSTMEPIAMAQANVHRCEGCRGLWFEMVDHETLKERAAQRQPGRMRRTVPQRRLAVGPAGHEHQHPRARDPVQGEQYNKIDRIKCPACVGHRDLIRMVDPLQPHIWFESCKGCYGRFYDAGEYRDFAEIEFADLVKDWNAPERL